MAAKEGVVWDKSQAPCFWAVRHLPEGDLAIGVGYGQDGAFGSTACSMEEALAAGMPPRDESRTKWQATE